MKSFLRVEILATCAVCISAAALAQSTTPKTSLLVLSKHDHTLAIVDTSSLRVVARVPVGDDPQEVVASADGHTANVTNYGFGAFHTLAVVELGWRREKPLSDLGAPRGPHGLAFQLGMVWFTAESAKAIGSYD